MLSKLRRHLTECLLACLLSLSPRGTEPILVETVSSMSKALALTSWLMSRNFCNLPVQHTQFCHHMYCLVLSPLRGGGGKSAGVSALGRDTAPALTAHPHSDKTALPRSSLGPAGRVRTDLEGLQRSSILEKSKSTLKV